MFGSNRLIYILIYCLIFTNCSSIRFQDNKSVIKLKGYIILTSTLRKNEMLAINRHQTWFFMQSKYIDIMKDTEVIKKPKPILFVIQNHDTSLLKRSILPNSVITYNLIREDSSFEITNILPCTILIRKTKNWKHYKINSINYPNECDIIIRDGIKIKVILSTYIELVKLISIDYPKNSSLP